MEEIEEVLDELYRGFDKSLSLDWIDESPEISVLKELLKMSRFNGQFAEFSFQEKNNN